MNLKVECPESYPEIYSGDVMCVAWKIRMLRPGNNKIDLALTWNSTERVTQRFNQLDM